MKLVNDDEDDFLFFLKISLSDQIISKVFTRKKSIKFTKFTGLQDRKMHVRKFQEEAMEYDHDKYMLAKFFSHSLKDDALKWYFLLPKRCIDNCEDLIHKFL